MKCAFAGCPEEAGDISEMLQDGAHFVCCSDHHAVIARTTGENVAADAQAKLSRASVRLTAIGRINHVSGAPGPPMVYFMRRANGHIKIGFSQDVEQRRRQLQTHFGSLDLLHTEQGGFAREKELHQQFAVDRVEGEWFEASSDLLTYLEEAVAPVPDRMEFDDEPITLEID